MADIKIKKSEQETIFEATGINDIDTALLKSLFGLGGYTAEDASAGVNAAVARMKQAEDAAICGHNARVIRPRFIHPAVLSAAISVGTLDGVIQPFDEIEVPLDTGGTVTVQVGYVEPGKARLVLKDCWDEAVMNEENTNKTGYYKSKGRKHVLEDIWPHISPEWQAIIKPRAIVEIINGERVEYADPLWLPSTTDVFGPSEDGYWKDEGENFQLPIFEKERDRVKECGDNGTYPWWLRSVYATHTTAFRYVDTDGSYNLNHAYYSLGFAPGFDI